ncbi:PIN domain-containing protein [Streptomyces graminilatus]|uniref:PIN domain-containing protein n=1 Tax=Streptomyces graminilatus TaxID=1464070 RepID=UPI0012FF0B15|nr:PIN domain-containing protein [Streptomyces graminilatus]
MIVLDTNQLRHAAFPHGAVLGMLSKIAEVSGHKLALPEMVVVEHVARHRHEVEQALTSARKAFATLGKAFGQDLSDRVADLSADEAAQQRRAALENSFVVLPTPTGAGDEALAREANRRPPAERVWEDAEGKPVKARGARDAVIWLTLLESASRTSEDIWFVSMDRDFGNEDKSDFHDVLCDEARTRLGENADRLRLLSGGIDQLLRELATPTKAPPDLEALLKNALVAHAVHIAMRGPDLFMALLPTSSATMGFESQGLRLDESRIVRSTTYQVGDRIWVSAQLACRATKTYRYSVPDTAGVLSARLTKVVFRFEATVLMDLENGKAHSAEAVSLGPITIEGTTHHPGEVFGTFEATLPALE